MLTLKNTKEKIKDTKDKAICKSLLWVIRKEAEKCKQQLNKTADAENQCDKSERAVHVMTKFCSMIGDKNEKHAAEKAMQIISELEEIEKQEQNLATSVKP